MKMEQIHLILLETKNQVKTAWNRRFNPSNAVFNIDKFIIIFLLEIHRNYPFYDMNLLPARQFNYLALRVQFN